MDFLDAHTHVQFAAFDDDWQEVIGRALGQNVRLVNVGTQKDTSRKAVEIARNYKEGVYATVGLHPIHTEKSYHDVRELGAGDGAKEFVSRGEEFDYEYYKELARDEKVVAIGECGLDYNRLGGETKKKQKEALVKQIELAREVKKPLMIHCRAAFGDLIDVLKPKAQNLKPGVVHFFTGSLDDAGKLLDMGFSFTFGGVITFPPKAGGRAGDYDEVIKYIPLDRILSETDAPYVAPAPYRGKRNEPLYVIEVVKKLAEIKDVSVETITGKIFENAERIFNF